VKALNLFLWYPKCSTCQKAYQELQRIGLPVELRNIKENNPTIEELTKWIQQNNIEIKKLFNTSGLIYKELNLKEKLPNMSSKEQIELLASNGMLVKRPILITKDKIIIGYKEKNYENLEDKMEILNKIKENSIIKIEENFYKVLSKSEYSTVENSDNIYWKYKLEKDKILVIVPSDKIIYFGEEVEETNSIDLKTTKLIYKNEEYKKIAMGNQLYLKTIFGKPLEKNCNFADFENNEKTKVLSLAILDNNKRSDIYAKYLKMEDISLC
jgi:arsenate reductase